MSLSRRGLAALAGLVTLVPGAHTLSAQPPGVETIVMVRHGEKPASEARGQLDCRGLNRALALPSALSRFGKPDAIFAADPAKETSEGNPFAGHYSYVRPLATIEPYAISLGMPVNAQIGATDIRGLQHELLKPEFSNSVIVVAWEHIEARRFAEEMLKLFGQSDVVPHWLNSDYETIYIFRITTAADRKRSLNFSVEHEDLSNSLSDKCPVINKPPPKETPPAIVPQPPSPSGTQKPNAPDQQP